MTESLYKRAKAEGRGVSFAATILSYLFGLRVSVAWTGRGLRTDKKNWPL